MPDLAPYPPLGVTGALPSKFGGAGVLQIGDGTPSTAADGIRFGTDASANLYRVAPLNLQTDGYLRALLGLFTQGYVYMAAGGPVYLSTDISQVLQTSGAGLVGLTGADLRLATLGKGLRVAEGANGKQGLSAAMVAGTLTVANSAITANSRLQLTRQNGGTNPGSVYESARIPGTSFTVTSTNAADTGQVAYEIFEPA